MKPLVTFADPEALLIDYLQDAFEDREESYIPATISPNFPASPLATAARTATVGTTNTSPTVTGSAFTADDLGATITGTGIPALATILAVTPGVSATMTANATATGSITATIGVTVRTHVQVELEAGSVDDYPVTERAQVRVTCYAAPGKRTSVKALASLAMGLLYTYPGDEDAAGAFILIGRSDVITDPDTGLLMCWFLARVDLKATKLAS